MINNRINNLRNLLKEYNIDAYIVPGTDPHQNEYIPEFWQRREWITGFTGSYGNFAVTKKASGLWTDSRYFIQAENELKTTEIKLFKINTPHTPNIHSWLLDNLKKGSTIGLDPRLITQKQSEQMDKDFSQKNITIKSIESNLIDILWKNKPVISNSPILIHPTEYSGKPVKDKLLEVSKLIIEKKAEIHIISTLDAIAWLFNLRGNDIKYNPLFISYAVITKENADIFVRDSIITEDIRNYLKDYAEIFPYDEFIKRISHFSKKDILIDPLHTSKWIADAVSQHDNNIIYAESPVILNKATKNPSEVTGFRNAHKRDGTALVKFFFWLKNELPGNSISEISASEKLEQFRSRQELYSGPSFHTISGYREHGAIVHYSASAKTDLTLKQEGLLLIDSGSQYLDGTTDVTRTISLGTPTQEEKFFYTYVLKCHINLAQAVFPEGTKGVQLDSLARRHLWDIGEDYGHGTGHGIGSYLNVHETPPGISSHCSTFDNPLSENMFLSIEPGIYKEGNLGIRIENLVIIVKHEKLSRVDRTFLCFEPVTLFPFDITLIDKSLLSDKEIEYINQYHKKIYKALKNYLSQEERNWLFSITRSL